MFDEAGKQKVRTQFRRLGWIMRILAALGRSARMSPAESADVVIEMDAVNGELADFAALECPTVLVVATGAHLAATEDEMRTVRAAAADAEESNRRVHRPARDGGLRGWGAIRSAMTRRMGSVGLTATLVPRGQAAAVVLDDEQVAVVGEGAKRFPVVATVNGYTWRTTVTRMRGEFQALVNALAIRAKR